MTFYQWLDLFTLAGINGLFALGLYIQMRTGQLSLASGAFLGVGAVTSVRLTQAGMPFELGILSGGVVAAMIGIAVAYSCLRLQGLYLAVATLAFTEIMRVLSTNISWLGGSLGLHDVHIRTTPWHVLIVVGLTMLWLHRHQRSVMGIRWDSLRTAEKAATVVGIETRLHRLTAFAVGAAILGLGGGLLVHYVGFLSPDSYGYQNGVAILLFVQLGGLGTAFYPLLAAMSITSLLELLRPFAENRLLIYALFLVVVTIIRTRRAEARAKPLVSRLSSTMKFFGKDIHK